MTTKLKAKIYNVWVGDKQMLIKAKTKQGAITFAAQMSITCDYADQQTLYEATKAGVEIVDVDADPKQPRLPHVDPETEEELEQALEAAEEES